jgi:hypothetical protein
MRVLGEGVISPVFISQMVVKTLCVSGLVFNCCTKVYLLWERMVNNSLNRYVII